MQTLRPHPAQLHQTLLSDDSYTCKLTQNFKVKDTKKFFSVRKVRVAKKKKNPFEPKISEIHNKALLEEIKSKQPIQKSGSSIPSPSTKENHFVLEFNVASSRALKQTANVSPHLSVPITFHNH
jgi:hypothetical protein